MEMTSVEIKQGIVLRFLPCDKFTSNTYSVHFLSPLTEKGAPLSNLLAKVLKKGCVPYPSQEMIARRSEELYSSSVLAGVSKIAETLSFFFTLSYLDNRFSFDETDIAVESFKLFSALLLEPCLENGVFREEIVAREKKALLDRINAQINNKGAYALMRCKEIMCEKESFRFSLDGKVENVEKFTSAELYSLYTELLAGAPIEIFYVGNESLEAVKERSERLFSRFPSRKGITFFAERIGKASSVKRVEETVNAVQGKLVMGFRTGDMKSKRDFYALILFDAVYGSSAISKLFMNVREKLSLCYYCSSMYDADKGVMFVASGVENENAEAAEKEILKQLDEIRNGSITANELHCAKESLMDFLRSVSDSAGSIERFSLTQCLRGVSLTPDDYIQEISLLTVEDVARVAKGITLDTVYFLKGEAAEEDEE